LNYAQKTLNTKVAQNFIPCNFCFRQNFIWALVCKIKSNSQLNNKGFQTKLKLISNFCVATWKIMNMKFVQYSKLYNFCFRQRFIWAIVWKVQLNSFHLVFEFLNFICLKF
jgi:hypothetical protein